MWNMPSLGVEEGIFQFKVYRKISPSNESFVLRATLTPSLGENSWDDVEVDVASAYLYRVASVNKCGETIGACQVQGSIIAARPAPVPQFPESGASGLALPVTFSWTPESEATVYTLLIAPDSDFT